MSALVLVLALFATVGSSDDSDSGSKGSSGTTGDSETTAAEDAATDAGEADEVDDVVVTACAKDDVLPTAKATLEVTNNSSEPSTYFIEIVFESADGSTQIGTGNAAISTLAPDQKKVEEVRSLEDPGDQEFTCTVSSVERLAA
ncbi:MAG TPA: hypothetical protein VGO60_00305 [Iamia sp.]|nr:hypothetical protein [Iamia sp.]